MKQKKTAAKKNEQTHPSGLLEQLLSNIGGYYLSDLHDLHAPPMLLKIKIALATLDADQYELQEWEDAIAYLTGLEKRFDTPAQAKTFLISHYHSL